MNPTPENETPLTDAAWKIALGRTIDSTEVAWIMRDFSRELERDRKRLRDALRSAESALGNSVSVLYRLGYDNTGTAVPLANKAWKEVEETLKQSLALDAKLSKETK